MAGLAVASGSFALAAPGARACVFLPVTVFYGDMSPAEREAWAKERAEQERTRWAAEREQFRADLLAGTIDSADGLARLLVPNVRESFDRSDCGPSGDGDGPPMPLGELVEAAFAGTELEVLDRETLLDNTARFQRIYTYDFSHACNLEFRARFTERLRRDVPRAERDAAYLLLSRSGGAEASYYRFTDAMRTIPVKHRFPDLAAPGTDPSVRKVGQAIADFWAEVTPQLSDPALTCPVAHQATFEARDREVERFRKSDKYGYLMRRATRTAAAAATE